MRQPTSFLKEISVKVSALLLLLFLLAWFLTYERSTVRSRYCYDEIYEMVKDRSAAEVESILGTPDTRERILYFERWIWWDYTFLDGKRFAPEERGQIVHLQILFESPAASRDIRHPYSEWRVSGEFGINYKRSKKNLYRWRKV